VVEVRRAVTADDAALHVLAVETFPLAGPPGTRQTSMDNFGAAHLSTASFAAYLADPARELWLAGDCDGYTMLVFGEPTDPDVAQAITTRPTVELSKCYVRAAHHGTGVAAALVEASMSAARVRGAAAMWLGVSQLNQRANRFYEKNGFRIVGEKTFMVGAELHHDFARERLLAI